MRGEYKTAVDAPSSTTELPPRARRIPGTAHRARSGHGTTSACAENTASSNMLSISHRNYLRVRGEYGFVVRKGRKHVELPPRARRIHLKRGHILAFLGTTSACAENTQQARRNTTRTWNYLRVRGEYVNCSPGATRGMELPPRARRIRCRGWGLVCRPGTTSACAENTSYSIVRYQYQRNYLRVRGEY